MSEHGTGLPIYDGSRKGAKTHCEYCGRAFRDKQWVAVVTDELKHLGVKYEILFCLRGAKMDCMGFWRYVKGAKPFDFIPMEFQNPKDGGDTGRFFATI